MRTRAAVLRDPARPYVLEEVELADPGPGEVRVRIVGTGFCHTDLTGRSGALGPGFLPVVLGHEGAGVVEEVGAGVDGLEVGDHVVLTFDSCGSCGPCQSAQPAYCTSFELLNIVGDGAGRGPVVHDSDGAPVRSRWFGQSAFADHVITTARNTVRIDRDLPLELAGPLGCGVQTGAGAVLNEMRLRPGQSLAVFGAGTVGLAAVMAAVLAGASDITVVDLNADRLALARELGATRTVDGAVPDLVAQVRGDGPGHDFSLDTTGVGPVMSAAVEVLGRPATCVLVGVGRDPLSVRPTALTGRHVTYVYEGSAIPGLFIPQLVDHWRAGRFPFDRLVRHYRLEDITTAEKDVLAGKVVKPVLLGATGPSRGR